MSTDQQYLYGMVKSIASGICDVWLANKNPGNLSHARWLTLANRILRLYVSTAYPTYTLFDFTRFIISVYGPFHFFNLIQYSTYLPSDQKDILDSACCSEMDTLLIPNVFYLRCLSIHAKLFAKWVIEKL